MRRRTLCAASALAMMTPIPVSAFSFAEDEFDVVVAGAGGAGLAAALSAAEQGASVLLVEKMAAIGGNTLRASGLFNASDPARRSRWVLRTPLPGTMNRRWRQDTAETTRLL